MKLSLSDTLPEALAEALGRVVADCRRQWEQELELLRPGDDRSTRFGGAGPICPGRRTSAAEVLDPPPRALVRHLPPVTAHATAPRADASGG